jgi:hypothetical protein
MVKPKAATKTDEISLTRWWQGLLISSIFSVVYLVTPMYIISSLLLLCVQYPTKQFAYIYASPMILSMIIPSMQMTFLANYMRPMLDYFSYEEICEISNEECITLTNSGKSFILAMQPHGVVSS